MARPKLGLHDIYNRGSAIGRGLERPADLKQLYHRVDKDSKNPGRLFVYFRF
ncbi:MAG: hypothetical protein HND55_00315 [Pseudomonadota bacterium]|nr:MAG: hypothetical protein HND55_00315 [Pseudomonadota bacterium]